MATAYGFFMLIIMAKLIYPIRKSRSRGVKKCVELFSRSPAITTADKITFLSMSCPNNLILCNNNLAFVILVNYIFYFE